jgi:hypothetical protein
MNRLRSGEEQACDDRCKRCARGRRGALIPVSDILRFSRRFAISRLAPAPLLPLRRVAPWLPLIQRCDDERRDTVRIVLQSAALVCSAVFAASTAAQPAATQIRSLGTVRLPHAAKAEDNLLNPGAYRLRLTGEALKPATGESPNLEQWVEFTQAGKVRARAVASVVPADQIAQVAEDRVPPAGHSRVDVLKGNDYLRVWVNQGGRNYLIHLPLAERGSRATGTTVKSGPKAAAVADVAAIVGAGNKFALVGKSASFTRAKVQHVAGARSFWLGDDKAHRVFVVVDAVSLDNAVTGGPLHDGDVVDVTGTVKRVPGSKGQVKVTDWGRLDDQDAQALSDRDVYVYASHVAHHG